jgi:hypothetical protein
MTVWLVACDSDTVKVRGVVPLFPSRTAGLSIVNDGRGGT